MKKYFLLLAILVSIFYLSQNVSAECIYAYPPSPLQDQESIFNCIKASDSFCDGSCGAFNDGCDGTKAKVKVISQCYPVGALSECSVFHGGDHIQVGVRYTYKDCATDTVNKKCYGGACVECLSTADCVLPKTCRLSDHTCQSPPLPCTAALSLSTTCSGTYSVSASISGSCINKAFEIRDGSTVKCSGTTSSAGAYSCSAWSITSGTTYTYNLYVDGVLSDTKTASCASPCSSYTTSSSCKDASCFWCASPSTPKDTCVQSSSKCAAPESCSAWNGDGGNCNSAGLDYKCDDRRNLF